MQKKSTSYHFQPPEQFDVTLELVKSVMHDPEQLSKLVSAGSIDLNATNQWGDSLFKQLCADGASDKSLVNIIDSGLDAAYIGVYGETHLEYILNVRHKSLTVIEALLKNGADPTQKSKWGELPVDILCKKRLGKIFVSEAQDYVMDFIKVFERNGYPPETFSLSETTCLSGESILSVFHRFACFSKVTKYMLDKGLPVDYKNPLDQFGVTPIASVFRSFDNTRRGQPESWNNELRELAMQSVDILIEAGADVNELVRDPYKSDILSPLLNIACTADVPPEMLEQLISYGADVNAKNTFGETALHTLIKTQKLKYLDFVRDEDPIQKIDCLLKAEADINARNIRGETPLHIQGQIINKDNVRNNKDLEEAEAIYKHLLLNGADMEIKNLDGKVAAEMAETKINQKKLKKIEKESLRELAYKAEINKSVEDDIELFER